MTGGRPTTSRFLSYVLRHSPAAIGLTLDEHGWVDVEVLLGALARHGRPLDRDGLARLLADTEKQRFELLADRIRATHGHSVPVDLQLAPAAPPPALYHGTVERFLPAIHAEGLRPAGRRHVHLSADPQTAAAVGARRGHPVVLRVDAAGMHHAGYTFYLTTGGVWLTGHVPPRWLRPAGDTGGAPPVSP
jgi:putative RNA 2'-phosphotransferase